MLPVVVTIWFTVPVRYVLKIFMISILLSEWTTRDIDDLKERAPGPEEQKKIHRMTEYCTRIPADHVPDPYYGGAEGFEYVIDVLEDACSGLLNNLR